MSQRHMAGSGAGCVMNDGERAHLTSYYAEDVRKLSQILDFDLSHWER